ncbi:hypothetical protein AB9F46_10665 [Rhizobium leguminosarum]|uniref:hypothetical protein n=2 Tax=Rhizobium leguminosarum TaxID=384 RepID=UPI003F9A28FC
MSNLNGPPVVALKKMPRLGAAPYAGQSGDFSIDNATRAIARGALGIGSYLDEMDAATNAALAPYFDPLLPDSFQKLPGQTFEERYNRALDIQRGKDNAFDEEHPYSSEALQGVGGLASERAFKLPSGRMGDVLLGAAEGFGDGEGGFNNRTEEAFRGAAEEALKGLGMDALKRRRMRPAEGGTGGGRKAGAKAALTRALLRAGGRNGGGGGW